MNETKSIATAALNTPIGELTLMAADEGLTALGLPNHPLSVSMGLQGSTAARKHLQDALDSLKAYFAGRLQNFDALKLAPEGTDFQRDVWRALYKIPYGETRSYGQIAQAIGLPKAMRAVGAANGRNPLAIIVPCHRVIGANGSLTGFGGGLPAKKWLLEFEAAHALRPGTQLTTDALMQWRNAG